MKWIVVLYQYFLTFPLFYINFCMCLSSLVNPFFYVKILYRHICKIIIVYGSMASTVDLNPAVHHIWTSKVVQIVSDSFVFPIDASVWCLNPNYFKKREKKPGFQKLIFRVNNPSSLGRLVPHNLPIPFSPNLNSC